MTDSPQEKRTDFLTARQLADHLQVSETTIRRLRRTGRIPAVVLTDRLVRFNLKDVQRALARSAAARAKDGAKEPEEASVDSAQMQFADLLADFETNGG